MSTKQRVVVAGIVALGLVAASGRRVVFQQPGMFGELIVEEDERGQRYLLFEANGDTQSAGRPDDPGHLQFEYTRLAMAGLAVVPEPKRALFVGLGGGTMPRFLRLHYPALYMDVVEIDPAVGMVARRFFGFAEDDRLKVHFQDGRAFVEAKGEPYDLVVLDAYGSDDVPPHLATVEFLEAVRARVTEDGVVVANLTASPGNKLYERMLASYRVVFPHVVVVDAEISENRIVLATRKRPLREDALLAGAEALRKAKKLRYDLAGMIEEGFHDELPVPAGTKELRDPKKAPAAVPAKAGAR